MGQIGQKKVGPAGFQDGRIGPPGGHRHGPSTSLAGRGHVVFGVPDHHHTVFFAPRGAGSRQSGLRQVGPAPPVLAESSRPVDQVIQTEPAELQPGGRADIPGEQADDGVRVGFQGRKDLADSGHDFQAAEVEGGFQGREVGVAQLGIETFHRVPETGSELLEKVVIGAPAKIHQAGGFLGLFQRHAESVGRTLGQGFPARATDLDQGPIDIEEHCAHAGNVADGGLGYNRTRLEW